MNPAAAIAHSMPGRVRLAIPARRGDSAYFAGLVRRFSAQDSVRHVKANPIAGSLLLEFSGSLGDLMRQAGAAELFDIGAGWPGGGRPDAASRLLQPIQLVSGRDINPTYMAGVLFTLVGLLQSIRGRLMVPAVTAFWYATTTFKQAGVTLVMAPAEGADGDAD